jgi:hypothetical protein
MICRSKYFPPSPRGFLDVGARADGAEKGYRMNSPNALRLGRQCPHTPSPLISPTGRIGPPDFASQYGYNDAK